MIAPNTSYRFVKDTKIQSNISFSAGFEFQTDNIGRYKVLEAMFISEEHLKNWLEDGRIEFVGRWKPSKGDEYFYITHGGHVSRAKYVGETQFSKPLHAFGNMFETNEQATKVAELLRDLLINISFDDIDAYGYGKD